MHIIKSCRILSLFLFAVFFLVPVSVLCQNKTALEDPYLYLEDTQGQDAVKWVEQENQMTLLEFENDPVYDQMLNIAQDILNSGDRIPEGELIGGYVYNFWRDEKHVRGVLRRTSLKEYYDAEPNWEILLDMDGLSENEGKDWVYSGRTCLPPDYQRCLISLSEGGKDAVEVREYDLTEKRFVAGGFYLKEFNSKFDWYDADTIIVATDLGEGSLSTSGTARIAKLWSRGETLADAPMLFKGSVDSVRLIPKNYARPEGGVFILSEFKGTFSSQKWVISGVGAKSRIRLPLDSEIMDVFRDNLIVKLNSDWMPVANGSGTLYRAGSLISLGISKEKEVARTEDIRIMFEPGSRSSFNDVWAGKSSVIVNLLEDVKGKVLEFTLDNKKGKGDWKRRDIGLPSNGITRLVSANPFCEETIVSYEGFLMPTSLFLIKRPRGPARKIKSMPHRFNSERLVAEQNVALSNDGTRIPYFIVRSKNIEFDGSNPTMLHAYGGFNIPRLPMYSVTLGKLWLEMGGVFVLANIRGGGEFGPSWHESAIREKRQNSFDDFIAVAQDIIDKGITDSDHLGIMGGSNGGLLVAVAFTQRPDLFGAVVCSSPLLDMLRYTKMPPEVGKRWVEEYGDPDSEGMRSALKAYSPYHNLRSNAEYPKILFMTSTLDDRVNPGHARKMTKKMQDMGFEVDYFENTSGGHKTYSNNYQRARMFAMQYSFLLRHLSD